MTRHTLQIGDGEHAYHVSGTGMPVVLIHGFPFDHTMWHAQLERLSKNYCVIAPDLAGFGGSTLAPAAAREGISMQRYAADLVAILEHCKISQPAVFVGFSMGGYILWQLVRHVPARVRALVLCDTRAVADAPAVRVARLAMADSIEATGTEPLVTGMLPKLLAASTLRQRPELVQQVTQQLRQAPAGGVAAAQRGMAARPDVREQLCQLDIPALVLVGAQDSISPPAEMQAMATALPQGEFCQIPDAGHLAPLENPQAVNRALEEFLVRLS